MYLHRTSIATKSELSQSIEPPVDINRLPFRETAGIFVEIEREKGNGEG